MGGNAGTLGRAGAGIGGAEIGGGGMTSSAGMGGHASGMGGRADNTGGRASGGRSGSGSGASCDDLLTKAEDALDAAQTCNLAMNAPSCRDMVDDPCGCKTPVARADSSETKTYLKALEALKGCPIACTALVCRTPRSTTCASTHDGSTDGRCTASDGPVTAF
jgi:hypothetical protein